MRSLNIDNQRSVLMHLVVDVGRNRLREAFQDLIVAVRSRMLTAEPETAFDEA